MHQPQQEFVQSMLSRFFAAMSRAQRQALLLDYDGTLAPFHCDPAKAVPYPPIRELLQQIQGCAQTRLVVVSGREAREVRGLLGIGNIEVWGCHGHERLAADETLSTLGLDSATVSAIERCTSMLESAGLASLMERNSSQVNGQFGDPGWVPIHYIHRSVECSELLAYYGAADVALVTPLKDGMNLISKEYCAARVHDDGVLILSEFAGSASQLHLGALLVNPNHTVEVARSLHSALGMSLKEQHTRMRPMRAKIRRENIFAWRDELPKP